MPIVRKAKKKALKTFVTGVCGLSDLEVNEELKFWGRLTGPAFSFEFAPLHLNRAHAAEVQRMPLRFRPHQRPPEVRIRASDQERADLAALLLYAAHALVDGTVPSGHLVGWDPYVARPLSVAKGSGADQDGANPRGWTPRFRVQTGGVVDIVGLAARLSRKSRLTEAAFYYLASLNFVSAHPMDLHPRYGDLTLPKAPNPMHRVWEAQALFSAFQAIECLKLTVVGASARRPSITNQIWDAGIREDLEQRLALVGVSAGATYLWIRRGPGTKLQRKLQGRTSQSQATTWTFGPIRDENIPFVDAINRAQWLRSNVSAHSGINLNSLHPIDVLNVQGLARHLVMNAARFPWWAQRERQGARRIDP